MLCPQKMPLILGRSDSGIYAPSLAGFKSTPPRFTSSVSSMGVSTRLPPLRRRSSLILSPTSLPTAIMAVAMVMPSAIARRATLLRRFCRRNDSKSRRKNMSMRELRKLRPEVSDIDHNGIAGLRHVQGNRVAATALAHALRVDGSSAVLANQPLGPFIKADRAANFTGVKQ